MVLSPQKTPLYDKYFSPHRYCKNPNCERNKKNRLIWFEDTSWTVNGTLYESYTTWCEPSKRGCNQLIRYGVEPPGYKGMGLWKDAKT